MFQGRFYLSSQSGCKVLLGWKVVVQSSFERGVYVVVWGRCGWTVSFQPILVALDYYLACSPPPAPALCCRTLLETAFMLYSVKIRRTWNLSNVFLTGDSPKTTNSSVQCVSGECIYLLYYTARLYK